jgi:ribosomal protein S18 acetylase RimI-like enzyme
MKDSKTTQGTAIRAMEPSDYDDILVLWKSLPGMGLSSADEREKITAFLGRNPTTCLVAEREERIVGTVLGGWDGRRGYVYHLAVDEGLQEMGIGTALMDEVEQRFRVLGARRIHLMIYRDNTAWAFYEKRGWFFRDDKISLMSKDLAKK